MDTIQTFESFLKPFISARKAEKKKQWENAASLYRQSAECLTPGGEVRKAIEEKGKLCEFAAREEEIRKNWPNGFYISSSTVGY